MLSRDAVLTVAARATGMGTSIPASIVGRAARRSRTPAAVQPTGDLKGSGFPGLDPHRSQGLLSIEFGGQEGRERASAAVSRAVAAQHQIGRAVVAQQRSGQGGRGSRVAADQTCRLCSLGPPGQFDAEGLSRSDGKSITQLRIGGRWADGGRDDLSGPRPSKPECVFERG